MDPFHRICDGVAAATAYGSGPIIQITAQTQIGFAVVEYVILVGFAAVAWPRCWGIARAPCRPAGAG